MGTGKNRPGIKDGAGAAAGRTARPSPRPRRSARPLRAEGDPALFEPLTEGERADALRILFEDKRLANMAKIGRYRVVAAVPLVLKPPHPMASQRLARIVAYDYASDRSVEAAVDLDASAIAHLQVSASQPMLSQEEELAAIDIAAADERVAAHLSLGDEVQAAMHYWSNRDTDLPYKRRSAAVLFGQPGTRPSLVAVVDLLDSQVTEVVAADQW